MQQIWRVCLFGELRVLKEPPFTNLDSITPQTSPLTRFRTQQTGALLAYMAYHPRATFSREELIGTIWPEDEPDTARTKLRMALSSLRRQLEPPGIAPGTVVTSDRLHAGLNRAVIGTDVARFEAQLGIVELGTTPEGRVLALSIAVSLFAGELLPGYYDDWIAPEHARLHNRLIQALTLLGRLLEAEGDLAGAIRCAERRTREEPLDEEGHAALIRLFQASGQRGAAIRQYRALEHILATEIGQPPSKSLQQIISGVEMKPTHASLQVEARTPEIVRSDHSAEPAKQDSRNPGAGKRAEARTATAAATSPLRVGGAAEPTSSTSSPPGAIATNLPPRVTRFFGRQQELDFVGASLIAMLAAQDGGARVLTLVGPGGAGKTRLAVEAGARLATAHSTEVHFVPLANLADAAGAPDLIASVLACSASQTDAEARIRLSIAGRPLVLILDNLEHLGDEGAEMVERLVAILPTVRFLVTSRQALRLSSERVVPVAPLPVPRFAGRAEWLAEFAGVQLFVDRAQAIRPDFQIGERNGSDIVELCLLLDGLPLALELAATWIGMMTPRQMLARYRDRMDLLTSRKRDLPDRQRTLYAAMDWSFNLLPPELRALFTTLSIFRGGWTLAAAEAVCEPDMPGDVFEALTMLGERSLLEHDANSGGEEARVRMLGTIRDYAWRKLLPDDRDRAARRHAGYFQKLAESANYNLDGADAANLLNGMDREMPNFAAALDWLAETPVETETALKMAGALYWFWWTRGYIVEGRSRLASVLARPDADRFPRDYCHALRGAAMLARYQGDHAAARSFEVRCIDVARRTEDGGMLAMALGSLGNTENQLGNGAVARALYLESLEIAERLDLKKIVATLLGNLGNVERNLKAYEEAAAHYRDALALHGRLGFRQAQTVVMCNLADLLLLMGNLEESRALLTECLPILQELYDKPGIAHWLEVFANLERVRSRPERAVLLHFAAEELREQIATKLPPIEQETVDRSMREVAAQLGPETFGRIQIEGRRCGMDAAIRIAMEQAEVFSPSAPSVRS